ncbi:MAG: ferredoxin [Candidatus Omnitrophica bacterium]|nr:ferredoxin [Candidatus Omnitrophota bacterium]MBU1995790.1 ferredoxin [Candidatus Omnitrophota bacterium]MBU4333181.1 ferredoxin [Candidatus Omnitrophota bacterium]
MKVIKEQDVRDETLKIIGHKMMVAARTAPKGKGIDNMEIALVEKDTIKAISDKLKELGEKYDVAGFKRDAENILSSEVMLLLGTRKKALGLKKCGMCGFENCGEKDKHVNIPCVFNTGDLGIAIGSAVSVAADNRVDSRVMYSVGQAVLEMGLFAEDVSIVYAIPISASSKNPFFDRQ